MTTKLQDIFAALSTDEEREFFDRSITRLLELGNGGVGQVTALSVAQAVAILRQEMHSPLAVAPLTTRDAATDIPS